MLKLDEKDFRILNILKENANLQTSRISKIAKIPITTVHNRIKKLRGFGVIKKYTIEIDFEKTGKPILAYVLITLFPTGGSKEKNLTQNEIADNIKKKIPVEWISVITGVYDIILKLRAKNMKEMNETLMFMRKIPGVDKTYTSLVLYTAK